MIDFAILNTNYIFESYRKISSIIKIYFVYKEHSAIRKIRPLQVIDELF